jgi:hypothetical protein
MAGMVLGRFTFKKQILKMKYLNLRPKIFPLFGGIT